MADKKKAKAKRGMVFAVGGDHPGEFVEVGRVVKFIPPPEPKMTIDASDAERFHENTNPFAAESEFRLIIRGAQRRVDAIRGRKQAAMRIGLGDRIGSAVSFDGTIRAVRERKGCRPREWSVRIAVQGLVTRLRETERVNSKSRGW